MRNFPILLILLSCSFEPKQQANSEVVATDSLTAVTQETITATEEPTNSYEPQIELLEEPIGERNAVFTILKNEKEVFRDTLHSSFQEIQVMDINEDGADDYLVQDISDVRSNLTFNLYLKDPSEDSFTLVKGFNEIKNPTIRSGLIQSYIVSGTDYIQFYELTDSLEVYRHDILLYDDHTDSSNQVYLKVLDSLTQRDDI